MSGQQSPSSSKTMAEKQLLLSKFRKYNDENMQKVFWEKQLYRRHDFMSFCSNIKL